MSNTREKFSTPLEIDIDAMDDHISTLIFRIGKEMEEHEKRMRQLRLTRLSLQSICRHQMQPTDTDHRGKWERCEICGFEQLQ